MDLVLPPYTFPSIGWMALVAWMKEDDNFILEVHETWQKQTNRSRFTIAGPNGAQMLTLPTIKNSRNFMHDVLLSDAEPWEKHHLKSLDTAYNKSPFYEYYRDDLVELYQSRPEKLLAFNLKSIQWILSKLQFRSVDEYTLDYSGATHADNAFKIEPYPQVFSEKNGFIEDVSALDILFNLGSEAGSFIQSLPDRRPYC